jgi:hypothetical protein
MRLVLVPVIIATINYVVFYVGLLHVPIIIPPLIIPNRNQAMHKGGDELHRSYSPF